MMAPAIIEYNKSGTIKKRIYFIAGVLHRVDGPACIDYFRNGIIKRKVFYNNGCIVDHT
jgi:antitoxin component YwqK of YwqJK toxin-antitoxin module